MDHTPSNESRMYAPEIEAMPRERLAALQYEKLKKILWHAYENVPHYRSSFDARGVSPNHLRSLDDLVRFPFTVKNDLRDNYPFKMFAVPRDEVVRVHASSGTTGKPTVVGYTRDDLETWTILMARCMRAAGIGPSDVVHNAYGYGLFTGGLGFHYGAERLGCMVTPVSGGNTERQIMLLNDFGATALFCTPSYALNIAETALKLGVDLSSGPLRVGMFGAEPWSEGMRRALDQRLGIISCDMYGLSEIVGPGVAAECAEGRCGLHGWEDCFLFEVIDPDTGERVPDGQSGELVITTLAKWAQPMIRYRTRDITRITTEPCVCGRTHLRILRVTGRNDDMLIIRGVNVYPSQIEAVLLGRPNIQPHYQLVVQREASLDSLTVEVEATAGVHVDDYARLAKDVQHTIKSMVGVSCRVVTLSPGELPRSEGKAVRVRDLRPKEK